MTVTVGAGSSVIDGVTAGVGVSVSICVIVGSAVFSGDIRGGTVGTESERERKYCPSSMPATISTSTAAIDAAAFHAEPYAPVRFSRTPAPPLIFGVPSVNPSPAAKNGVLRPSEALLPSAGVLLAPGLIPSFSAAKSAYFLICLSEIPEASLRMRSSFIRKSPPSPEMPSEPSLTCELCS